MGLTEILKNMLFGQSEPTDFCEEIDGNLGKMTVEEVLAVVQPIVDEENLHLKSLSSSLETYPHPTLMKDVENRQFWQVTILYRTQNGMILDEGRKKEYCWLLVDDKNREIKEKIFAR